MKNVLFFMFLSILAFSCGDDDDLTADLFYDSGVNDAPFLDAGEYIAAARFPASDMSEFQGRNLEGIEYYLLNTPNQCEVRVYQGGSGTEPGTLIYNKSVTTEMEKESWNLHTPDTDVVLSGEELWIAVRVVLNDRAATIGCDPGPAVTDGDWFNSDANNQWETFRNFSGGQVNINWNIRGQVSD
jgi:hypothetical protein